MLSPVARARAEAEEVERRVRQKQAQEQEQEQRKREQLEARLHELDEEMARREGRSPKAAPSKAAAPVESAPMSRPEPALVTLAAPPFKYTLVREVPVSQGPEPALKKISNKRNAITDDAAWFATHGLSLPVWETPSSFGTSTSALPSHVPDAYRGEAIQGAIQGKSKVTSKGSDLSIAIYAASGADRRVVVVRDAVGDALGAFDFGAYRHGPKDVPADRMFSEQEVTWAQVQDGVLFACTSHLTYARSSGGLNAFITAIELSSGELMWQSQPLVCNSRNFLLRDGWIITGYGFTAEPDFLYVLDARTGKVASTIKLKSGPSVILAKSDELYVRTYNRDYVFELR